MTVRKEVIGNATLYLGDCLEVMASFPSCFSVNAVITDPPYGVGWVSNSKNRRGKWLDGTVIEGKENAPIIGDDRPFDPSPLLNIGKKHILWGANAYAALLPSKYGWLVWDKRPGGERNTQSDCELAWTDFLNSVRKHSQRWMGIMRDGDESPFKGGSLVHPTQKPAALMRWCIDLAGPGAVLDPYMGSGSTGVAAAQLERPFIGIEIHEPYFNIACERIENAQRQERLFA